MSKMIDVGNFCPFCGAFHIVTVQVNQYFDWINGELAQNAFPNLSATEREQLISNICPECQIDVFGEDEEEW